MAGKTGRFDLHYVLGETTTGIENTYCNWISEKNSDGTYNLTITLYGQVNVEGVIGGRTCNYNISSPQYDKYIGTVLILDNEIHEIKSVTFSNLTVDKDGIWNGDIYASLSFTSEGHGIYADEVTVSNLKIGFANYTLNYYTNYGSNNVHKSISELDTGATCSIINGPSRSNIDNSSNFTITGNANGGDSNRSITATKTITTSYVFKGWSTNKSSTAPDSDYAPGKTITIKSDLDLYAIWSSSVNTTYSNNTIGDLIDATRAPTGSLYNITLNPNNGQSSIIIEAGNRTTYKFDGWASSSTSKTPLKSEKTYTSDTTVYAIWTPTTIDKTTVELPKSQVKGNETLASYTVKLNPNDGTVNPTSMTSNKYKLYKFEGWSTKNGSYSDKVSYSYTPTNKQNHNLYALWSESENTESIKLPEAHYPSFKFLGWGINPNSTEYLNGNYTPTQDIVLYAIYIPSYTGKPFIWHNGKWHKIIPHLRHDNIFNQSIDND